MRFYYSTRLGDDVPTYGVYAQRVREMLDQYVAAAHGKIRLEIFDPQPFSDVEDRAVAFGLQGVPLDRAGRAGLFRSRRHQLDRRPAGHPVLLTRARALSRIRSDQARPHAGLPKTHRGRADQRPAARRRPDGGDAGPADPAAWRPRAAAASSTTSSTLGADLDAIPTDVDVLMMVQPQNLPRQDAVRDRPVRAAGRQGAGVRRPVFRDPGGAAEPDESAGPPTGSDLAPLFKAWGVEMLPECRRRRPARRARVSVPAPGRGAQPIDYVAWLDLNRANLNRDDPITADLSQITMATAGILEAAARRQDQFRAADLDLDRFDEDSGRQGQGRCPMSRGCWPISSPTASATCSPRTSPASAATAFPDGPPKPAAAANAKPGAPPAPATNGSRRRRSRSMSSSSPTPTCSTTASGSQSQNFFGQRVIVPIANNGDFVANAVDVLAGGDDLDRPAQPRHLGAAVRGRRAHPARGRRRATPPRSRRSQQKLKETAGQARRSDRRATRRDTPAALSPSRPRRSTSSAPTCCRPASSCARCRRRCAGHRPAEGEPRILRHRAGADHRRDCRDHGRRRAARAPPAPRRRGVRGTRCADAA